MTRATKRAISTGARVAERCSPRMPTGAPHPSLEGHLQHTAGARDNGAEAFDGWRLGLTPGESRHLDRSLSSLTEREREVACAVCVGGSNEAVADRLCIALPTLRTHLMRIYQKLGVASKSDLIMCIASLLLTAYRQRSIHEAEEDMTGRVSMTTELDWNYDGGS